MDLTSIFKLLKRRKLVVIPATLLVCVLLAVTLVVAPPVHRANVTVLLLPPEPPTTGQRSHPNPLTRFNDISVVADILKRIMLSDSVGRGLKGDGLRGTFTVAANTDFQTGPIIQIVAEARTEAAAIADGELIVKQLQQQLTALQESQGTDSRYFITSNVIVPATRAPTVFSSVLRRLIVALALGVGLVIGSAVVADALDGRIRRRSKKLDPATIEAHPRTD